MTPFIYYCSSYAFDCEAYLPLLPQQRQQQALRFKTELAKKNCIGAYILLLNALKTLGVEDFTVEYSKNGKPYIKGNPYYFSLSHSDYGFACAVDKFEIGIDIQDFKNPSQSLLERVCSKKELEAINGFDDKAMAFTKLWTFKESVVKKNAGTLSQLSSYEFEEIKNDFYRFGCHFKSFDTPSGVITACGEFDDIILHKKEI